MWVALLIGIACATELAMPAKPGRELAAIITYETHTVTSDGVTRETRYQERLVRGPGHVWTSRLLPRGARPVSAIHGHEIDLALLARHTVPTPEGGARTELVSVADRLVVDLERADYGRVDVTGRWDDVWYLLPSSFLATLRPGHDPARAGARWLERRTSDETVRVLWSDAHGFPIEIQRSRADGSQRLQIRVSFVELPAVRPWTTLSGFPHKLLADFGD